MKLKLKEVRKAEETGPSRARKEPAISAALTKIVKKAAQIADLMTGEDVEADLKVLREAKQAYHQVYSKELKDLIKVPDHKTRLAATTLSRAYHEGKPIERSVNLTGSFEDFDSMRARVAGSPLAAQLLGSHSLQNTSESAESGGKTFDLPKEDGTSPSVEK